MTKVETQVISPPNVPPQHTISASADFPDEIKELGDRIVKLSVEQVIALNLYMEILRG